MKACELAAHCDTAKISLSDGLAIGLWLARHASDAPAILSDLQEIASDVKAKQFSDAWSVAKSLGDLIAADLNDFPWPASPPPAPTPNPDDPVGPVEIESATAAQFEAALEAAGAIGDGSLLQAILAILSNPEFLALLTTILKLFGV